MPERRVLPQAQIEDIRNRVLGGTWRKGDLYHEVEEAQQSGEIEATSNYGIVEINQSARKLNNPPSSNSSGSYGASH